MRMRIVLLTLVLLAATFVHAQRPEGMSVYTWTREDLFAGLIDKDFTRLKVGMDKLEDILKQNPNDADAIVMKGLGMAVLAVRDFENGDNAGFNRQYDEAVWLFDRAAALDPKGIGVNAVRGGALYLYNRLPEGRRPHALDMARKAYAFLYTAQEKGLDQLPPHLKGEVLAGVAETELRSGNRQQAEVYLKRIVDTMPGTPYAGAAQKWLSGPESVAANSRLVCQSCHEPGRLRNRLPATAPSR